MKWGGRELNPLHLIALRLVLWPVLQLLRILICAVVVIGWGTTDAKQFWRNTQ